MFAAFKLLSWKAKLGIGLAILLSYVGVFFAGHQIGYTKGVSQAKVQIAQFEAKATKQNSKLKDVQNKSNEVTVIKYVDRVKVVEKNVYVNRDVIKTVVPEQFNVSKGWLYAHNQAVLGLPVDPELAKDPTPSKASDLLALLKINENYGVCLANKAQVEALLEWAHSLKTNAEVVNNEK